MTDQAAADRERIAGSTTQAKKRFAADRQRIADEMRKLDKWPSSPNPLVRLEIAVMAFEVLCEPRGWELQLDPMNGWHATNVECDRDAVLVGNGGKSGSHAADVCRLVCEVLDREAKG